MYWFYERICPVICLCILVCIAPWYIVICIFFISWIVFLLFHFCFLLTLPYTFLSFYLTILNYWIIVNSIYVWRGCCFYYGKHLKHSVCMKSAVQIKSLINWLSLRCWPSPGLYQFAIIPFLPTAFFGRSKKARRGNTCVPSFAPRFIAVCCLTGRVAQTSACVHSVMCVAKCVCLLVCSCVCCRAPDNRQTLPGEGRKVVQWGCSCVNRSALSSPPFVPVLHVSTARWKWKFTKCRSKKKYT